MFTAGPGRLARPLVALAALGVLAAGCTAAADDHGARPSEPGSSEGVPSTGSSSPTSSSSTALPHVRTYVALGDSYTAAPLFHQADAIKGCLRSPDNYPAMVATKWDLDLTDVSCSGATTDNMVEPQHFAAGGRVQPPQFDALSAGTDLVTVGIGANDFRFFGRMIVDCIAKAPGDPHGSPCEQANAIAPVPQRIEDSLDVITNHVATVMQGIREHAPNARILMIGYPQLIPSVGMCKGKLPLADGDYAFVRRLNLSLADAVQAGALSGTAGAEYVDLISASQGHDICSTKPWIAGVRGPQRQALGLHPYRREQRAVAHLIGKMLEK